jgi:hypothetical protein
LTHQQRRNIRRLHRDFRNNFTHFIPQGWRIEKAGLPRIVGAALDAAGGLMRRDYVTRLLDVNRQQRLQQRLTDALATARAYLPSSCDYAPHTAWLLRPRRERPTHEILAESIRSQFPCKQC